MTTKQQSQCQTEKSQFISSYIPKSSHNPISSTVEQDFFISSFSLYCFRRGKHSNATNNYQYKLLPITQINSLEEFYEYFLSIKKPSQLLVDSKMMLFYKNCKPFWEEWLGSGCLIIQFKNNKEEEENLLDTIWQYLCYSLVGNNIDLDVIGLSLCKRQKLTLLQIWLRKDDRAKQIGLKLQEQIRKQLPPSLGSSINSILKVKHKRHSDSITVNKFYYILDKFNNQRSPKFDSSKFKKIIIKQFFLRIKQDSPIQLIFEFPFKKNHFLILQKQDGQQAGSFNQQ